MPKKLLIFLGILLGISILIVGVNGGLDNFSSSSTGTAPQNVNIASVRSREVDISWTSADKTPSTVLYGTTQALGSTASQPGISTSHLVTISNLKPNTAYYFFVRGDKSKFAQDGENGVIPFTFRTLAEVVNTPIVQAAADTSPKQLAINTTPPSAFGQLVNKEKRVLAESTTSGNAGIGTTGQNSSGATPAGGVTIPTILLTAAAALFVAFGFRLLKN